MSDTDGEWKLILMISSNFGYLKMKDTSIKSPRQMVTWLFWTHGFLRPLIFLLSWNTSDRLWYVGSRMKFFLFWPKKPGRAIDLDLGGARFHFQMIHRSLKNSYVAGSLHPWSSTLFMQRRRPETLLHRSSLILNLKVKKKLVMFESEIFTICTCPWQFVYSPAQI